MYSLVHYRIGHRGTLGCSTETLGPDRRCRRKREKDDHMVLAARRFLRRAQWVSGWYDATRPKEAARVDLKARREVVQEGGR